MNSVDFKYTPCYCKVIQNYGENSSTRMLLHAHNFSAYPRTQKKWVKSDIFEDPSIEFNTVEAVALIL